jgi:hypothetical protein
MDYSQIQETTSRTRTKINPNPAKFETARGRAQTFFMVTFADKSS